VCYRVTPALQAVLHRCCPGDAGTKRHRTRGTAVVQRRWRCDASAVYWCQTIIPVEFSIAAYRFGHSMVRPVYRLNAPTEQLPIFASTRPSLAGFHAFPAELVIDWGKFFVAEVFLGLLLEDKHCSQGSLCIALLLQ